MALVEFSVRKPSSVDVHVGGRVRVRRRLINMTQESLADLPLKAAARLPRRGVRIAFVSFIPRSKQALMQAREETGAQADQDRRTAPLADVVAPMRLGVVATQKVAISAAPILHIDGQAPDGRVHAVISTGG